MDTKIRYRLASPRFGNAKVDMVARADHEAGAPDIEQHRRIKSCDAADQSGLRARDIGIAAATRRRLP
jgi:hypothetical protein